ncbi:MAG TPA: flagellar export chaperone FliS [Planctomycetota bacterium]|nr:flagellar export chaperone FliS [Planctomycetota bacterium]
MPVAHGRTAYQTAAYQNGDVATLSQRDLIVRLYQGAERFMARAQEAMAQREIEAAHINCQKAKAIFAELLATLNFEQGGDVAVRLRELYLFINARIGEANLRKRPELIAEVAPIVATLRQAWEQVPQEFANVSAVAEAQRGHAVDLRT